MTSLFTPPPFPAELVPRVAKLAGLEETLRGAWETCFWAGFQSGAVAVGIPLLALSLLIVGYRRRSPP